VRTRNNPLVSFASDLSGFHGEARFVTEFTLAHHAANTEVVGEAGECLEGRSAFANGLWRFASKAVIWVVVSLARNAFQLRCRWLASLSVLLLDRDFALGRSTAVNLDLVQILDVNSCGDRTTLCEVVRISSTSNKLRGDVIFASRRSLNFVASDSFNVRSMRLVGAAEITTVIAANDADFWLDRVLRSDVNASGGRASRVRFDCVVDPVNKCRSSCIDTWLALSTAPFAPRNDASENRVHVDHRVPIRVDPNGVGGRLQADERTAGVSLAGIDASLDVTEAAHGVRVVVVDEIAVRVFISISGFASLVVLEENLRILENVWQGSPLVLLSVAPTGNIAVNLLRLETAIGVDWESLKISLLFWRKNEVVLERIELVGETSGLDVIVVKDVLGKFQQTNIVHHGHCSVVLGVLNDLTDSGALLERWFAPHFGVFVIAAEAEFLVLEVPGGDGAAMSGGNGPVLANKCCSAAIEVGDHAPRVLLCILPTDDLLRELHLSSAVSGKRRVVAFLKEPIRRINSEGVHRVLLRVLSLVTPVSGLEVSLFTGVGIVADDPVVLIPRLLDAIVWPIERLFGTIVA